MRKETRELYRKACEKWDQLQFIVAIEECSELIKAICKAWRNPSGATADSLVEEIVDVKIMAEQLEIVFNCEKAAGRIRRKKLRRLKKLLKPKTFMEGIDQIDDALKDG
ncbi:MAG: hypothetical protein KAW52_00445 [candidate division Zixibacteria bacterium]|nr:hypothetical protein [candidate division Zixibacteria bacterium]